ncbi:PAS domain S-box protein [Neorhizobium sp. P12A]|uniref:PAS domain-containing protein n=1 Tax=Neorhizobium sp. P12A TaxID=2268027 RepID=UPI00165E0020|nr:PAS domain S-box protein [Neorhizobium sp. P12A]
MAAFDPMTEIDAAQVIDAAAESMLVTTAELDWPGPTIVYVNPAFERMTGWHRTEVIGKTPRLLQGPETDGSVFENLRSQLAAGRTWEGTAVNYRKDGSTFMMEWSIVPLRDEAGKIRQYLAVQRDVTARIEVNRAALVRGSLKERHSVFDAVATALQSCSGRISGVRMPSFY